MAHNIVHTVPKGADQMPIAPQDLSAMVAARICHDLVSPLGAIGNGLALIVASQQMQGPEIDLVVQSTECANAKLRFFRVAFGIVSAEQMISQAEINSILRAMEAHQKQRIRWTGATELTRRQVKLVFLLLMCLETALPWGGDIDVMIHAGGVQLIARAERMKIDDALWASLGSGSVLEDVTSARVQFLLAGIELRAQGARLGLLEHAGSLSLDLALH
ncbi:MAG: histidine phosphotransferase [Roseinatronobacter sp.]|nr:histidine phosphotransferase [Roseinatronobacter sp.]